MPHAWYSSQGHSLSHPTFYILSTCYLLIIHKLSGKKMTLTHFLESTISLEESKVSVFIRPDFSETRFQPWVGFIASSFATFLLSCLESLSDWFSFCLTYEVPFKTLLIYSQNYFMPTLPFSGIKVSSKSSKEEVTWVQSGKSKTNPSHSLMKNQNFKDKDKNLNSNQWKM